MLRIMVSDESQGGHMNDEKLEKLRNQLHKELSEIMTMALDMNGCALRKKVGSLRTENETHMAVAVAVAEVSEAEFQYQMSCGNSNEDWKKLGEEIYSWILGSPNWKRDIQPIINRIKSSRFRKNAKCGVVLVPKPCGAMILHEPAIQSHASDRYEFRENDWLYLKRAFNIGRG